jgi:hypothetical protein
MEMQGAATVKQNKTKSRKDSREQAYLFVDHLWLYLSPTYLQA